MITKKIQPCALFRLLQYGFEYIIFCQLWILCGFPHCFPVYIMYSQPRQWMWPTCSRLSSSGSVPVSPLLLIGISMVAALLIMLSVIMHYVCEGKGKREKDSRVYNMKEGRDGKTARPKYCFEDEWPKSAVKTAKSLGRWQYNCHKQARRWLSKSKAKQLRIKNKNNTPMKGATTMSRLAEVGALL